MVSAWWSAQNQFIVILVSQMLPLSRRLQTLDPGVLTREFGHMAVNNSLKIIYTSIGKVNDKEAFSCTTEDSHSSRIPRQHGAVPQDLQTPH